MSRNQNGEVVEARIRSAKNKMRNAGLLQLEFGYAELTLGMAAPSAVAMVRLCSVT